MLLCGDFVSAQSAVQGFGSFRYDAGLGGATDIVQVRGGTLHNAVQRSSGELFAFGSNGVGQCAAPALPAGHSWIDFDIAPDHGAAVRSDLVIVGWGSNAYGQATAPPLPPGVGYLRVACGDAYTVALRTDGEVVAFGLNHRQQCNVPPLPVGEHYVDIAAGPYHALARRSDEVVVAWGFNDVGQTTVPPLPPGVTVAAMAAGGRPMLGTSNSYSLLLRSDGRIQHFGSNLEQQAAIPALPPGLGYTRLDAGSNHGVALRSDGALVTWGGSTVHWPPPALPPATTWTAIAAGLNTTLAVRSDGRVIGWGDDSWLALPLPAAAGTAAEVSAGIFHVVFRSAAGQLTHVGAKFDGLMPIPALPANTSWSTISAGHFHTSALRSDGALVSWGYGFGINPPQLPPPGLAWVAISAGANHTLALRSDQAILGFGLDTYGQRTPPPLPPGTGYVAMDGGSYHSLALRSDGQVVAWGWNGQGQCNVPSFPTGVRVVRIAAGGGGVPGASAQVIGHSLALLSDGTVVAWGDNQFGQCDVPPLPPGRSWVAVAAGVRHSLGLASDGRLFAWGDNSLRQVDLPAFAPGTGALEFAATEHATARVGVAGSYTTFAAGCPGSAGVPRLVPFDLPRSGRSMRVVVRAAPSGLGVMASGLDTTAWGGIALPWSLQAVGMPNCDLHVSADATAAIGGSGGELEFEFTFPLAPSLLGRTFHQQALVLDPAANAFGAVMSDAATAVIGAN